MTAVRDDNGMGRGMRWKFGRGRQRTSEGVGSTARSGWADRLESLGRTIDTTGLGLRDVAVALGNGEAWVCACVWRPGRLHSGWATIALRLDGITLVPIHSSAGATDAGSSAFAGLPYAPRLRAVGTDLDRVGKTLRDPSIVETDGGFVVTALVADTTVPGSTPRQRVVDAHGSYR
jgi:hypothetical protein